VFASSTTKRKKSKTTVVSCDNGSSVGPPLLLRYLPHSQSYKKGRPQARDHYQRRAAAASVRPPPHPATPMKGAGMWDRLHASPPRRSASSASHARPRSRSLPSPGRAVPFTRSRSLPHAAASSSSPCAPSPSSHPTRDERDRICRPFLPVMTAHSGSHSSSLVVASLRDEDPPLQRRLLPSQ
jgi:hypothetical protein